jgi:hypothetical protein
LSSDEGSALSTGDESNDTPQSLLPLILATLAGCLILVLACALLARRRSKQESRRAATLVDVNVSMPEPQTLGKSRSTSRSRPKKAPTAAASSNYSAVILPQNGGGDDYTTMPRQPSVATGDYDTLDGGASLSWGDTGEYRPMAPIVRTHAYMSPETPYTTVSPSRKTMGTDGASEYQTGEFAL